MTESRKAPFLDLRPFVYHAWHARDDCQCLAGVLPITQYRRFIKFLFSLFRSRIFQLLVFSLRSASHSLWKRTELYPEIKKGR